MQHVNRLTGREHHVLTRSADGAGVFASKCIRQRLFSGQVIAQRWPDNSGDVVEDRLHTNSSAMDAYSRSLRSSAMLKVLKPKSRWSVRPLRKYRAPTSLIYNRSV